jgi:glycosyltransferase involved in cell wall biosynthesis
MLLLPSLAGGGAERVVITLANAVAEAGWRVHLVTVHGSGPLHDAVASQVHYHDLGLGRVGAAFIAISKVICHVKPDVVLCTPAHLNLVVLLTRILHPSGTRLFIREANMPSQTLPTQPLPAVFRALSRWLYPRADIVLCPARRVADELVDILGVPRSRVSVLPNPVDWEGLAKARGAPIREDGDGLRLVAAGRLTPQKNFAALIECMRDAPTNTILTLFGTGPLEAELRALVRSSDCPDRVRFRGFSGELWRWFAGADAVVLPSLWEGMPNVALEALGCGAKVVAMRSAGGVAELKPVNDDTLILVDDMCALAQALWSLEPGAVDELRQCQLSTEHHRESVAKRFLAMCDVGHGVSA